MSGFDERVGLRESLVVSPGSPNGRYVDAERLQANGEALHASCRPRARLVSMFWHFVAIVCVAIYLSVYVF